MQLIILPLAKKGKEAKQKMIEQVVDLAKQIEDENTQAFVITGILVSSDKFIDRDYAKSVRRYLSMTKVFQILEEEKQEAINIAKKNERRNSTRDDRKFYKSWYRYVDTHAGNWLNKRGNRRNP